MKVDHGRVMMAGNNDTRVTDMQTHTQTYTSVISLLKWGGIACFAIGALVVWLIA